MSLRRILFSLLVSVTFAAGAAEAPATASADIGQVHLRLPVLAEFEPPSVTPKAYMRLFEDTQRPVDRLMAVMLSKDYVAKVRAGDKAAEMSRYLVVKTSRRFDTEDFSQDDLVQVKALLRHPSAQLLQLQQRLLTQAADRMTQDVGKITGDTSATIHQDDVRSLGVFDEQPNSIAFASLQTTSASSKAGEEHDVQVVASAIIRTRGKMLGVVVYDEFSSPANIEWTKGVIREYIKRVAELNP